VLGHKLSAELGQNVVPDNRPGAGGNLGVAMVARASPDGYTLLLTSSSIAISPSLYTHLGYDPEKDLAAVARLAAIQNVLLLNAAVPAKTLRQFIELARSRPGKLNYGSGGAGTTNHLANELLMTLEKIKMVHVPYKGASVAMLSLIGGEVDEVVVAVASALQSIHNGRVRAIAVLSDERVAALLDVPTTREAGVSDFVMPIWFGMFAPAATPHETVLHLHHAVANALGAPDFREKLAAEGIDPWPGSPEELTGFVRSETARYAAIIRRAGVQQK
jgi:tripartite-type tricarboxylate transporter receptor subunit TctC